MATPTKRRKTNGFKASPQTIGSLDFFFGKQKEDQFAKARNQDGLPQEHHETPCRAPENSTDDVVAQALTDEELARKLQREWDSETKARDEAEACEANVSLPSQDYEKPASDLVDQQPSPSSTPTKTRNHIGNTVIEATRHVPETLSLQSAMSSTDTISTSIPFDESPLQFDPSRFLPDLQSQWVSEGGNASYGLLTRCFVLVNATQSRIKIVDTLVNFLRIIIEGDPESLLPAVSARLGMGNPMTNDPLGLASYECDITTLHIVRAWAWRFRHF